LGVAQVTITETGDKPDKVINVLECQGASGAASTFGFQWTINTTTAFTDVEVKISDKSGCPDSTSNSSAHTDSLGTFTAATTTTSLAAPDLLSRIGIPTAACNTGANVTVNVCVIPRDAAGTAISGATMTGTITFDRTVPPTPAAPNVVPGDRALRVSWTAVSGSKLSYRVEATPSDTPTATPVRSNDVTGTSVRLGNLEIGRAYNVVLIAISEGGNLSAPSPIATGTPVEVNDFWRLYQGDGGVEQGGCSTTGLGSLALLAFVPFALRRRRS
ncbi:MAG TPA: fibronectin type III domain-containing protein, partial [Anaeromyxobacteraceae bacterium]|nr:fibronectin type III domain-containing protein [Anaeromyxobacteraceae bacterium]